MNIGDILNIKDRRDQMKILSYYFTKAKKTKNWTAFHELLRIQDILHSRVSFLKSSLKKDYNIFGGQDPRVLEELLISKQVKASFDPKNPLRHA